MEIKDLNEYQELAMRTQPNLPDKHLLLNMALGLTGESGEFADIVKKEVYHNHMADNYAKAQELGDILWYLANAAQTIGYDLQEIAEMNIDKLRTRYPQGFSSVDSQKRVDVK